MHKIVFFLQNMIQCKKSFEFLSVLKGTLRLLFFLCWVLRFNQWIRFSLIGYSTVLRNSKNISYFNFDIVLYSLTKLYIKKLLYA